MLNEKGRILIVDDEEIIRDSCKQALAKEGYLVRDAEDGDSGMKVFEEFHPDLVLIDLKMPGKSGLELLEAIEAEDPTVVKIVITGYATVSSALDAMKKGAYDFIPKPFSPDEIRLIVGRGLEKRRLLLEARALRIERERLQRNMISLISHELRAPLAATVQYLEVILGGMAGEISSEAKDMIARSNLRLRELLELLSKWLNLATFDSDRISSSFQDIDLSEVVKGSFEVLRALSLEKKIRLSLEESRNPCIIKGNRLALEEILNNLIGNAIKYNKEGGWVKVKVYDCDDKVNVEVIDGGIGIPEEHLCRIFDEFYRVDGRRNAPVKGSGLGLSIAKKLVEVHGGVISVKSTLNEGTTFEMSFPKDVDQQKQG